jgi:leucyl-tRNA synthetase
MSFALEDGKLLCHTEIEKMSKRWLNVVNPETMVGRYGADTFRMYVMFLGPITDSKPWNTHGIEGVYKFLRKFWNLFYNRQGLFEAAEGPAPRQALKALHTCIQRVGADLAKLSLNTCVSHFMICVNELHYIGSSQREVLEPLVVLLSPFAPHLCEELWESLGHTPSISQVAYPQVDQKYLEEAFVEYPVMINGKLRAKVMLANGIDRDGALALALADEHVKKWVGQGTLKNAIFVPGRIINLVVA